ncbi:hypothetical protein LNKW23_05690 [Paralimibaculum aggregatum]|uniref:Uncharacterized protein n=1 Tax=Paralimibaculum aggregatum TaxID=3036245 RepID=A0ABQ6LG09_9RHOB|nr:hypothetical protein LNKW23_05690 [Limibaculum sp. NKW23]
MRRPAGTVRPCARPAAESAALASHSGRRRPEFPRPAPAAGGVPFPVPNCNPLSRILHRPVASLRSTIPNRNRSDGVAMPPPPGCAGVAVCAAGGGGPNEAAGLRVAAPERERLGHAARLRVREQETGT